MVFISIDIFVFYEKLGKCHRLYAQLVGSGAKIGEHFGFNEPVEIFALGSKDSQLFFQLFILLDLVKKLF